MYKIKTKTDFLVSDRSCSKTDDLRPHHCLKWETWQTTVMGEYQSWLTISTFGKQFLALGRTKVWTFITKCLTVLTEEIICEQSLVIPAVYWCVEHSLLKPRKTDNLKSNFIRTQHSRSYENSSQEINSRYGQRCWIATILRRACVLYWMRFWLPRPLQLIITDSDIGIPMSPNSSILWYMESPISYDDHI